MEKGWEKSPSHEMMIPNGWIIPVFILRGVSYNWWGKGPILWEERALFQAEFVRNNLRELAQSRTTPCLMGFCVMGPTLLGGNWVTKTEIAPGHWEATSRGRTTVWLGGWGRCISCIGRKHWGKGRCVQNNGLGFCLRLGKLFAGREECTCVGIKKWLFDAKFQAAIQPSFHSSSTPLPKQSD